MSDSMFVPFLPLSGELWKNLVSCSGEPWNLRKNVSCSNDITEWSLYTLYWLLRFVLHRFLTEHFNDSLHTLLSRPVDFFKGFHFPSLSQMQVSCCESFDSKKQSTAGAVMMCVFFKLPLKKNHLDFSTACLLSFKVDNLMVKKSGGCTR